jgi:hypothetical protein
MTAMTTSARTATRDITSILDLPFAEGAAEVVLGIGEDATIDHDYTGFGWTRVERLVLADGEGALHELRDVLVLALHAADDGPARADDVLLDFTVGEQTVTCWLSAFLARWLPRLPAAETLVLALCNPHQAALAAPAGAYHGVGPVDSWLDGGEGGDGRDGGARIRLVAQAWRRIPAAEGA